MVVRDWLDTTVGHIKQGLAAWFMRQQIVDTYTAASLNNLGRVLHIMGDRAQAKHYHEQALAVLEERLGPNHPYTNIVHKNLIRVTKELGQTNERPKPIE